MKRNVLILTVTFILLTIILAIIYPVCTRVVASTPITKANIDTKIVYANFWNSTTIDNSADGYLTYISYTVVLNITNCSPQTVNITSLTMILAEDIIISPSTSTTGQQIAISGITSPDESTLVEHDSLQLQIEPANCRLVAFKGICDTNNKAFLEGAGKIFTQVAAEPAYVRGQGVAVNNIIDISIFHHVNQGLLYNELLSENQTLSINGFDATVNNV